jgi:hypothetical protein
MSVRVPKKQRRPTAKLSRSTNDVREARKEASHAGLISIDESIDEVGRRALEEARRREKAARLRKAPKGHA